MARKLTMTASAMGLIFLCLAAAPCAGNEEEMDSGSIGYRSVFEALSALRNNPASRISIQGGWTIITLVEKGNYVLWSFTPESHSAHPSAVRREVIERDDQIFIAMEVLCESSKPKCDDLVQEFEQLNQTIVDANDRE